MTQLSISGRDVHTGQSRKLQIKDDLITTNEPGPADATDYLAPGLVDLQVNGYGGHDLNDGKLTSTTVVALCEMLAQYGVTSFLPTLITAPAGQLTDALATIAAACQTDPLAAAMIAGVHIEGPSISPVSGPRGAHPPADIRPPAMAEFENWQKASGDLVKMITIAPEQPFALGYIQKLVARNVRVAIGHSAATPEQIHNAVAAGASLSTHLGNGVAAELPRHPNLLWAQLANDALGATLIADGHHLSADVFKAIVRCKGVADTVLISDSVALAGMPAGNYKTAVGGAVTVDADGRVSLSGTPFLAGAGLPLIATVDKAANMAGLKLAEALTMASNNPARLIGREASLQPGVRADVMRFSVAGAGVAQECSPLQVKEVLVAGRQIVSC